MADPLEVTLYRKDECGLCHEAEAMLVRIARRVPLRIRLVDIDTDPSLQERYFLEIPVVACRGSEIARAPISERSLEAALREMAKP